MSTSAPAPTSPRIGWRAALRPATWTAPSTLLLIAANLLPLYGVLVWDWDLFTLLLLYWLETGVIGLFGMAEMALVAGGYAVVLVPFFMVHFGGFMAGHLFFLVVLFGGTQHPGSIPSIVLDALWQRGLWVALLALVVSHGVSFLVNVLQPAWLRRLQGAHDRAPPPPGRARDAKAAMMAPYGRVVIMHVTIILGGFLALALHAKVLAYVLLIVLKIAVDMAAHVRKNAGAGMG